MSTNTQAKITFNIPDNINYTSQYVYMGVYASDYQTLISSNYYNSDMDTSRTDIYLTVEEGCYIVCIYYTLDTNSIASFYVTNPMTVSDLSTIPTQDTPIKLNINISNKLTAINSILDLSTDLSSNTLSMGVFDQTVNKYVSLISGTNTSTLASDCLSKNYVIFGDAAKTEVGASNSTYYSMHNICVSTVVLSQILGLYGVTMSSTGLSWVWIILIIFIVMIIIAVIVGGFLWYRHKHK